MRDRDIRAALVEHLGEVHARTDTLIRHEVGICAGRRRIDVAVVNGEIVGYEIKSDDDTLTRLAGQVEAYGQVLDRAVAVTTERHVDKVVDLLPGWWGVVVAQASNGRVALRRAREAALNDRPDAFATAQLLWRAEALEELSRRGLARGLSRKARHYVWAALAEALPQTELREVVRTRLKERRDWPGGR